MALIANNKMSMKDAIELVKYELLAQEAGNVKQIPTLAGKPGIGKTESLKALAKELGYDLITVQLSAVAPEEFSGIPEFLDAPQEFSKKYSISGIGGAKFTRWSVPELVANANYKAEIVKNNGGKGVVVLFDDIHAADPALERYMFNLFLDKVVGQYKLADNVLVCAAMNDSDEAGFRGFNSAVLDRLAIYPVEFDFDHWYKIMGAYLDNVIAAFLRNHKERAQGEESVDEVQPSPRSWTELSNFVKFMRNNGVDVKNNILRNAARARVGEKVAAELVKFNILYEKFDFESKIKLPVDKIEIPADPIEQILFANIIRYAKTKEQGEKIIELINKNKNNNLFISELVNEISVLHRSKHNGKNPAVQTVVDFILKSNDEKLDQVFFDAMGL